MSNLKALPWSTSTNGISIVNSATHFYDVVKDHTIEDSEKFIVRYRSRQHESPIREATGFATMEDAKAWCWNHYNEKMQPYVKPMPTWINYKTEKPKEGDDVVITWLWMGDRHTIHLGNYSPRKIDYLDDAIEVYWSISPFVKQGE